MEALESDTRINDGVIDRPKADGPKLKFSFLRCVVFSTRSRPSEASSVRTNLYQKYSIFEAFSILRLPSSSTIHHYSSRILQGTSNTSLPPHPNFPLVVLVQSFSRARMIDSAATQAGWWLSVGFAILTIAQSLEWWLLKVRYELSTLLNQLNHIVSRFDHHHFIRLSIVFS